MVEITLGDYVGFIFREAVRAREMADAYSLEVAKRYAADPVLQLFAVPRFKVPKMEITVPVLISGTKFNRSVRFDMPEEAFVDTVRQRVGDLLRAVVIMKFPRFSSGRRPVLPPFLSDAVDGLARDLYAQLKQGSDEASVDNAVKLAWSEICETGLAESDLADAYREHDPEQALVTRSTQAMLDLIAARTVVDGTTVDNLLVDPETHVVATGSTDATVFVVKAELLEEGFFIRSIADEAGGVHPVVEFE